MTDPEHILFVYFSFGNELRPFCILARLCTTESHTSPAPGKACLLPSFLNVCVVYACVHVCVCTCTYLHMN